jgi:hypothetical protein
VYALNNPISLVDPTGLSPDPARTCTVKAIARDKILNNEKCRTFIEGLLDFLYGGPQTAQTIVDRLNQASFNPFVGPLQDPNSGPLALTILGSDHATVFPRGAALSDNDLAVTFIHETFHMGPAGKTDQQMWQSTIGNLNVSLPQSSLGLASQWWGQKLRDNCQ